MSSNLAYAGRPERSTRHHQKPERRIEIVSTRSQRRARPRPLYALIAIGGLFALFMAQLLMSIVISDSAYRISSLSIEKTELTRTQQSLNERVDTLASTQNLAAKAESLGMVLSTSNPAFLDAASGKVIGKSPSATLTVASVVDDTGSLVPNSLLPKSEEKLASVDASVTDATAAAAAVQALEAGEATPGAATPGAAIPEATITEAAIAEATAPEAAVTGPAADGTVRAPTLEEPAAVTDPVPGAPSPAPEPPSVPSNSALPVPVTR